MNQEDKSELVDSEANCSDGSPDEQIDETSERDSFIKPSAESSSESNYSSEGKPTCNLKQFYVPPK